MELLLVQMIVGINDCKDTTPSIHLLSYKLRYSSNFLLHPDFLTLCIGNIYVAKLYNNIAHTIQKECRKQQDVEWKHVNRNAFKERCPQN